MRRRTLNNLSDLLLAADILGEDDPVRREQIALLLGFEVQPEEPEERDAAQADVPAKPAGGGPSFESPADTPAEQPPSLPDEPQAQEVWEGNEAWVEGLTPKPLYTPRWFDAVEAIPEGEAESAVEPLPDPLFKPEWVRTLLSFALSVADQRGPLDLERVAKLLSENEPVETFPRLPRLRLADGAQVLIDLNDSMRPFAQDQFGLLAEVKRIIPTSAVSEQYFFVCPTRGVRHTQGWTDELYRPPPPSTPVLLLTDLGAARAGFDVGRPRPGEWLRFAEAARRAGCPVVAVVPYPPSRVAPELRRAMYVVTWDRTTTTGRVQRLREESSREGRYGR